MESNHSYINSSAPVHGSVATVICLYNLQSLSFSVLLFYNSTAYKENHLFYNTCEGDFLEFSLLHYKLSNRI
jgi:hypothetical protein